MLPVFTHINCHVMSGELFDNWESAFSSYGEEGVDRVKGGKIKKDGESLCTPQILGGCKIWPKGSEDGSPPTG